MDVAELVFGYSQYVVIMLEALIKSIIKNPFIAVNGRNVSRSAQSMTCYQQWHQLICIAPMTRCPGGLAYINLFLSTIGFGQERVVRITSLAFLPQLLCCESLGPNGFVLVFRDDYIIWVENMKWDDLGSNWKVTIDYLSPKETYSSLNYLRHIISSS